MRSRLCFCNVSASIRCCRVAFSSSKYFTFTSLKFNCRFWSRCSSSTSVNLKHRVMLTSHVQTNMKCGFIATNWARRRRFSSITCLWSASIFSFQSVSRCSRLRAFCTSVDSFSISLRKRVFSALYKDLHEKPIIFIFTHYGNNFLYAVIKPCLLEFVFGATLPVRVSSLFDVQLLMRREQLAPDVIQFRLSCFQPLDDVTARFVTQSSLQARTGER